MGTGPGDERRCRRCAGCSRALLVLGAARRRSATPIAPYDGSNPFRCKIQNVGTGIDFPDPDADPFCVEFDKTPAERDRLRDRRLPLEGAGAGRGRGAEVLLLPDATTGPARSSRAQQPELWHWDGSYFFDKARGMGGVRVDNFCVGGLPADPRLMPGLPAEFSPYFGPGGGGAFLHQTVPADPNCAARVDTPQEAKQDLPARLAVPATRAVVAAVAF